MADKTSGNIKDGISLEQFAKKGICELRKDPTTSETISETTEGNKKMSEQDIRIQILLATLDRSSSIYQLNKENEDSKEQWRNFFMKFCCCLLGLSMLFIFVMIVLDSTKVVTLSKYALIAMFTYIVTNLFSILFFMIKYVHNDKYLETFKTVTHKLLDYLIADKNGISKPKKE